jgi:hypothetical protein
MPSKLARSPLFLGWLTGQASARSRLLGLLTCGARPPQSLMCGPAISPSPTSRREGRKPSFFLLSLRIKQSARYLPFMEQLRGYLSRAPSPSTPLCFLAARDLAQSGYSHDAALAAHHPELHAVLDPSPPPSSTRVSSRQAPPPIGTCSVSNGGQNHHFRKCQ